MQTESNEPGPSNSAPPDSATTALARYVPLAVWPIVILTFLCIALRIIGYGYLPAGDARRHVALAFTQKTFPEIVVMRATYVMDHNPGWDLFLRKMHQWGGLNEDNLLTFSTVLSMLAVFLVPLAWLRRPEAWLAALLAFMVAIPEIMTRFTQDRPYLVTMALCMAVLFAWTKPTGREPTARRMVWTALAIAASTWIHGTWYLWVLPVAAFVLAGWWRAAVALGMCWLAGAFAGGLLTGHPFAFLLQAVNMARSISHESPPIWLLVGELQPIRGEFETLVLLAVVFLWRKQQGKRLEELYCAPLLAMIAICWILGFKADRFWADWGLAAVFVWLARQAQVLMEDAWDVTSAKRVLASVLLAAPLFLHATNDLDGRYTGWSREPFLEAEKPELNGWLPDDHGIFYCANLTFFYNTFYKYPDANWRYILGYEPALMPDEDLNVYRGIQLGHSEAYETWLKKMTKADRLAIYNSVQPGIGELEWQNAGGGLWIGRLPR